MLRRGSRRKELLVTLPFARPLVFTLLLRNLHEGVNPCKAPPAAADFGAAKDTTFLVIVGQRLPASMRWLRVRAIFTSTIVN